MFKKLIPKILLLSAIAATLTACHVVDLDQNGKPIIPMSAAEAASFINMTPKAIAAKLWPKVIQDAHDKALELFKIKKNKNLVTFVKIRGVVSRFNDSAFKKSLVVDSNNGREIELQVGSIVRGNSIRDSISFLSFDMFKNQIQFARLSKELNKKAVRNITKPYSVWVGKKVDVLAAVTIKSNKITHAVPLEMKEGAL